MLQESADVSVIRRFRKEDMRVGRRQEGEGGLHEEGGAELGSVGDTPDDLL